MSFSSRIHVHAIVLFYSGFAYLTTAALAFSVLPNGVTVRTITRSRASLLHSSSSNPSEEDTNSGVGEEATPSLDLSNFNPFQYQAERSAPNNVIGMTGTQISLRKTGMQQLVGELLSAYGNEKAMQAALEERREFLLEPLQDLDAVLDPESIYNGIHTRKERFVAYRTSMRERIETAKDAKAKRVLTILMEYVLQFE